MTLISLIIGDEGVGLYGAAYTIVFGLLLIPAVFCETLYPLLSSMYKTKPKAFQESFNLSFKYLWTVLLPISIGGVLLSPLLINAIYGPNFEGSRVPFSILMATFSFIGLSYLFDHVLVSMNKEKIVIRNFLIGVIINVMFNIFLIPKFGVSGAAIATFVSTLLISILGILSISKELHISLSIFKPMISSTIMGLTIWFLIPYGLFSALGLGILVYGLVLMIVKHFSARDLELLKELKPRV